MEQEIVDYILQAQRHGLADFEIKQNLLNVGWDANAVEQSFIFAKAEETHTSVTNTQPAAVASYLQPQARAGEQPVARIESPHAAVALSDQHFQDEPAKTGQSVFKKPVFWIILATLILLAGGAYGYYALVLANPTKIWDKFSQAASSPTYQTKFDFSYSDPGQFGGADTGFQLKDIKLALNGSGYINTENAQNPESNSKIQYTFSSGNTSFSTGFEYILQNKVLYLNVGSNPILDMISAGANGGKKIDWIKIDLAQLQNQASSTPEQAKFYEQLTSSDFKNQLQKIWQDAKIIKVDKYIGREKINGITTLHFKNSVDKQALKGLVNQYVVQISKAFKGTGSEINDSDAAMINEVASQIVDKIQVKEFETWVGMADFKLYRVHLVANSPSVISIAKNSSGLSLPQSNDAKRLADARQISSAVELYSNDQGGYPEGVNGKPVDLIPKYLSLIPEAPPADGSCNTFYNTYWYQPTGKKTVIKGKAVYDSYQMTFCLGWPVGGYKAGIAKLTPSGISDNIKCPGSAEHCAMAVNPYADINGAIEGQIKNFIDKLDFSAEIKVDADYTDYGKKVLLSPPADAFDIFQKMKQQTSGIVPTGNLSNQSQAIPLTQPSPIKNNDHIIGGSSAKNSLVLYSDYQCPACAVENDTFSQLQSQLKDTNLIFRYFPLLQIHKNAIIAAYAAEAAGAQGKYWQMHDLLFKNQSNWAGLANPLDEFAKLAQQAGVKNITSFKSDITSAKFQSRVQEDLTEALGLNLAGTPTLYFNGKQLQLGDLTSLKQQAEALYK